jgi:type IV pilus assembly protein PilP|tara:strand:- start:767 stop:1183 length:417 start_codon:yes stop_codon:yes gene_type:complete
MKIKFAGNIFLMFILVLLGGVSHAAENAFGSLPTIVNNNSAQSSGGFSSDPIDQSVHPLLQNSITSNTIIGIMISPSQKTAFIRTASGDDYFVKVGDKLGNANGSITDINHEAIVVTEDGKVVYLAVRNRSEVNDDEE